jgi:predicted RNase H-like nuclease (RuvC/YqgF family)
LPRALIVGIDPGVSTGIAILDTKGELIAVASKRYAKRSEITKYITKFGNPVIIASDVNPPPESVKKIAKALGCKLFYPEVSLSNAEKNEIVKKYEIGGHQKDALAAGIKAFKSHHELFLKIKDVATKLELEDIFDEIVIKLIKEKADNIADAIEKIKRKRK